MITTQKEKKICEKFSKRGNDDLVHCNECPLKKGHGSYDFRCKSNSHYNRKSKEWEYDNTRERKQVLC